ncbi:MAG: metal dependent phosphohydrolase [Parcubacteria group bacterium]|nr:metal dependent phosphohydrolase [Parcubacteria group bacterium]
MDSRTLLERSFDELGIEPSNREAIVAFLEPLRIKHLPTFDHSVRVGFLSRQIGAFTHMSERALFYAGTLHDVGKAQVRLELLEKMSGWTERDSREMEAHVMNGYKFIREKFNFSAEILLWHHRFQLNSYPKRLPQKLVPYSRGTSILIPLYGRFLSLADVFDASHRTNDKLKDEGVLDGALIKKNMFKWNPDQRELIQRLYNEGIFTE